MRRSLIGTAGHVDHGKTSLVEALTGTDCDRWQEEKSRGITIDLGFAHLETETDGGEPVRLSFVDVPGHERFVHNALAGLAGIRFMMLVVAADEGVEPQTREHLAICSLLDIPAGLVVLTKSDLVDQETLELARLEVEEELAGTPFADSPMIAVSSRTGEGIEELKRALVARLEALPENQSSSSRAARLPLDRSFHLPGLGVVATGTLAAGRLRVGDHLEHATQGHELRVRSLQVHGEDRTEVVEGERTSVQLAGASLEEVPRGSQLVEPGSTPRARGLLVRYRHLPDAPMDLEGSTEVRFHHTTEEILGRIRPLDPASISPGTEATCVLYLRRPAAAWRGDRFVLRRPSPATTLGGGVVLDPEWRKPRGRDLASHCDRLRGELPEVLREWLDVAREPGLAVSAAGRRLGLNERDLAALFEGLNEAGVALRAEGALGHWVGSAWVAAVAKRAKGALRDFFKRERMADGMPKAAFVQTVLPKGALPLADDYLRWLAAGQAIVLLGDRVGQPGRATGITEEESDLAGRIVEAYEAEGLTPRSPAEIQRDLGAQPKIFEGLLRHLVQKRRIVRLPDGLFVSQAALDELKQAVLEDAWEEISVPSFKERFGLSRKWAIPLLEYLDAQRITQRRGNVRLVLRARGATPG